MKWIKKIFLVGLLNFAATIGVIAAGTLNIQSTTPAKIPTKVVAISPTQMITPTPIIRIIKKIIRVTPTVTANQTNESQLTSSTPTQQINPTDAATQPVPTNPVPTQDPLANKCIITIDGTKYDVTDFRYQHSGGNVFTCGADMSVSFHNRHPDSFLSYMARFKV